MFSSQNSQVSNAATYIEDVFSTYLYTGNGSTQTITNGIDLSGKGGFVWIKERTRAGTEHSLFDTVRGISSWLTSDQTLAAQTVPAGKAITSFNSDGFSLGPSYYGTENSNGQAIASWTFRKQPKFFDVVTYTGNGTNGRTVAHSLGSVPACMIIKRTDSANGWAVYHRSMNTSPQDYMMRLNATDGAFTTSPSRWNNTLPTATEFTLSGNDEVNGSGATYVAYLFAHNAGGFGLTGTDNVISCGSFTAGSNSAAGSATIDLGYEPQWILTKNINGTSTMNWQIYDNMRGVTAPRPPSYPTANALAPNTSGAESDTGIYSFNSTGFVSHGGYTNGDTIIYIAIRKGPMKVPTDATKVFIPVSATPSGSTTVTTNFPVDLAINAQRDAGTSGNKVFWDRLRGSSTAAGQGLFSTLTNAEVSYSGNGIGLQSNTSIVDNYWNTLNGATTPVIYWNFRRAPSFFDEVCYTGTGSATTVTHNLGVTPELMIVKSRSGTGNWKVWNKSSLYTNLWLNSDVATQSDSVNSPTATTFAVFNDSNTSSVTYVAYLFATAAGVSKVGSYTGTGTTLQINCGFTAGSRFVLIKRTDDVGSWYVWDVARGIVSGNDPYLLLNSTAAEVTSTDYIDTYSAGFEISSTAPAAINASGGTFIFLAIA